MQAKHLRLDRRKPTLAHVVLDLLGMGVALAQSVWRVSTRLRQETACSNCAVDQYSTAVSATYNTCRGCPLNSDGPEASAKQTDCKCSTGSSGPDGVVCTKCLPNTYKSTTGKHVFVFQNICLYVHTYETYKHTI